MIGIDQVQPARDASAASIIEAFIPSDGNAPNIGGEVKQLTAGRGADVDYDAVGGVTTPAALAHRGRLVVISGVGRLAVRRQLGGRTWR